jgi:hypothetical protein
MTTGQRPAREPAATRLEAGCSLVLAALVIARAINVL